MTITKPFRITSQTCGGFPKQSTHQWFLTKYDMLKTLDYCYECIGIFTKLCMHALHWNREDDWLTHWGRVKHICVSKLNIIGSDNGLSPYRRQAIIWTNAGILLIGPLGTNFSEISIENLTFSLKKMHLKVSSAERRPFCLGLNVLTP